MDGLIYNTDGRIGGSTTHNTQELNEKTGGMRNEENWQKTRVVRSGRMQEVCDVKCQRVKQVAV